MKTVLNKLKFNGKTKKCLGLFSHVKVNKMIMILKCTYLEKTGKNNNSKAKI